MKVLLIFTNASVFSFKNFCRPTRKLSLNTFPELNKYHAREGKFLNRMINGSSKKKKLYFDEVPTTMRGGGFSLGKSGRGSKENNRRVAVLNSLFMKHISDMMINSDIAKETWGKGLEISRVAMAPDFNQVNVFWATNKDENTADLEAVLPKLGVSLRHELSQLRVMGIVPRILFVKDKHYGSALRVDYLLSIADFGEDHVSLPKDCEFNAQNTTNIAGRLEHENTDENEVTPLAEEIMPVMRQDIFNLDRDRIMIKIMKSLQKSRALHRFQPNLVVQSEGTVNNFSITLAEQMTMEERKNALAKFIFTRKIMLQQNKEDKYGSHLKVHNFISDESDDNDYSHEDFHVEDYLEEDDSER